MRWFPGALNRIAATIVTLALDVSCDDASGFTGLESTDANADGCPAEFTAKNAALGYMYSQWARSRCMGVFDRSATQSYELRTTPRGLCWVIIRRYDGDFAVVLNAQLDVLEGLVRDAPASPWRPLDPSLCLMGPAAGLAAAPSLRPSKAEVDFAFSAVVAARVLQNAGGSTCATPVDLVGAEDAAMRVQTLERSSEHVFTLVVAARGQSSGQAHIEVRLQRRLHWQGKEVQTQSTYAFLGSMPEPCDIFSGNASAVNSSRRLSVGEPGSIEHVLLLSSEGSREVSAQYADSGVTAETYEGRRLTSTSLHSLPSEYDLARHMPACQRAARGQGRCSSSWAIAAIGAFEKQLCRLSDPAGPPQPRALSVQQVLGCAAESSGCDGGSPEQVHAALLRFGAIDDSCLPYASGTLRAPRGNPIGIAYCAVRPDFANCSQHGRVYARYPTVYELGGISADSSPTTRWLSGTRDISMAVLAYGAVSTTMLVYADLFGYRTGVYRQRSKDYQGKSAVQLVGWGVEPSSGVKYWIAEASWGPKWGENQHFKPCSVQDCQGEFCSEDNGNPDCMDSIIFRDGANNDCQWYTKYDPGCRLYIDQGQLANCPKSCKTCAPLDTRPGELCGRFRVLRGENHCGVEAHAAHGYVAAYAPSTELLSPRAPVGCADRAAWSDAYGRGCAWYASNGRCLGLPDIGQRGSCPQACGTCGTLGRVGRAGPGWAE